MGKRVYRFGALAMVLATVGWLSGAGAAQAAGDTLDQSQTVATRYDTGKTPMAQTFVAGTSGQVDRVSLMLAPGPGSVSASVEIQSVAGGKPDGVVLGSTPSAGIVACCNQWEDFSFSPAVTVTAGTSYAIVLVPSGYVSWYDSFSADNYKSGQLWVESSNIWSWNSNLGYDFAFEDWVVPGGSASTVAASITGAPGSAPEGSAVVLDGKAVTSGTAAAAATAYSLSWTVTKDGNPYATGTGSTLTVTPDDEGTFVVSLSVSNGTTTAKTSVTFTGTNVAPAASISGVTHDTIVLVADQPVTFAGAFADPSTMDTHIAVLNYGDGSAVESFNYAVGASSQLSDTHVFAAAGTYTISYTVTDDDGGTSTATFAVKVDSPAEALASIDGYLQGLNLDHGLQTDLSNQLREAIKDLNDGNVNNACNQLDAFLNKLSALTNSQQISRADSDALAQAAWSVHRELGCDQFKVGWLVLNL